MNQHIFTLFLCLTLFWLLNSGHYSLLILSLGLASIILVLIISQQMDIVDHESQPLYLTPIIFSYYVWLIKEIVKANITVVKHIWLGKDSISPQLKTIKISQKTDMGKVIYANSITLTPGTVAIKLQGDEILVHALLTANIASLEQGEMDARISKLESQC
ncbi:Na+/H+ antiporter subunit E [Litorilituus sediminis]|uniref:Cation transporter n=1 Tax=Litorilituus sediminis TaxID=718192 RepID=A0A4P6P1B3_9GAMM|nr:Na+/H+ antiporter subunit E [Litorilituus sediminis]QBG35046.1 cation transporter [Litorilituus sediminis]